MFPRFALVDIAAYKHSHVCLLLSVCKSFPSVYITKKMHECSQLEGDAKLVSILVASYTPTNDIERSCESIVFPTLDIASFSFIFVTRIGIEWVFHCAY